MINQVKEHGAGYHLLEVMMKITQQMTSACGTKNHQTIVLVATTVQYCMIQVLMPIRANALLAIIFFVKKK